MPEQILHHDTITDDDIADAMLAYGGSFVELLAALWRQADPENRARIKASWPEYWNQYKELVALKRKTLAKAAGRAR